MFYIMTKIAPLSLLWFLWICGILKVEPTFNKAVGAVRRVKKHENEKKT